MRVPIALLAAAGFLGAACSNDFDDPTAGVLRVSVTTTGGDLDLDGYRVIVDTGGPVAVGTTGSVVISGLPTGTHDVSLSGLARNCTLSKDNPRVVILVRGDTASATFEVHCLVTGLLVSAATTGIDLDADGYGVVVDSASPTTVATIGTVTITRLSPGAHALALAGVAANCLVGGQQPVVVTIASGQILPVAFGVACAAVTGSVAVTAATTGADPDANGFTVQLDGGGPYTITTNGTVTIGGLSAGDHSLDIGGVATNCAVTGGPSRTVHVITGGATRDTARTTAQVGCVAVTGAIGVTAATAGADRPTSAYTAQVDAGAVLPLAVNATTVVAALSAGDHTVLLGGAPANCAIAGANPQTVHVAVGAVKRDTAPATFQVNCVAVTGSVAITAATAGPDPDLDGYTVQIDNATPRALAANGTVTVEGLGAGSHTVTVAGVAPNCTVGGGNPRGVTLAIGSAVRDTARTTFQVNCVTASKIAFVRNDQLAVGFADGSGAVTLLPGDDPAWSPDGSKIGYTWINCDYYQICYQAGLHVMKPDGTGDAQLTHDASDGAVSWHPLGTKIAFARYSGGRFVLFVANSDGSSPTAVLLPASVKSALQPAWSPDGTTLAFTCQVDTDNSDICLINPNGTDLRRLTSDAASDTRPAWKPDGTQIAFATNRFSGVHEIAVMNADGSSVTRVVPAVGGYQPTWSPDGAKILFATFTCDIYFGCTALGLAVVNGDGSGFARLTSDADRSPNWRR